MNEDSTWPLARDGGKVRDTEVTLLAAARAAGSMNSRTDCGLGRQEEIIAAAVDASNITLAVNRIIYVCCGGWAARTGSERERLGENAVPPKSLPSEGLLHDRLLSIYTTCSSGVEIVSETVLIGLSLRIPSDGPVTPG